MFTVKYKEYWTCYCQERKTKTFGSLDDMWKWLTEVWKKRDTCVDFVIQGARQGDDGKYIGFITLTYALPAKMGYRGTLEVEEIEYNSVTIFDHDYCSPKLAEYIKTHDIKELAPKRYGDF